MYLDGIRWLIGCPASGSVILSQAVGELQPSLTQRAPD
jgi:hypothetical protein